MTADQLRLIRCDLNLTQAQFAILLGFTRDGIAAMESGRRPISTVTAMAIEHLTCRPNRKRQTS